MIYYFTYHFDYFSFHYICAKPKHHNVFQTYLIYKRIKGRRKRSFLLFPLNGRAGRSKHTLQIYLSLCIALVPKNETTL